MILEWLWGRELEEYLDLALWYYQEERRDIVGPTILNKTIDPLASAAMEVSVRYWEKLSECPDLTRDVLQHVALYSSLVTDKEYLDWPSYLCKKNVD